MSGDEQKAHFILTSMSLILSRIYDNNSLLRIIMLFVVHDASFPEYTATLLIFFLVELRTLVKIIKETFSSQ